VCDNECEGCERPQDVYCLELNERREEKVKGKLAGACCQTTDGGRRVVGGEEPVGFPAGVWVLESE
jgi:hypothetical protein